MRIRQKIANYLKIHKLEYENIELEIENGLMNIDEYIIYIQQINSWEGELENYEAEDIYNINIADFKLIPNKYYIPQYHHFIYNLNQDNMYNKDLFIFTQINGNHFNLLYDKNYNCFKDDNSKLIFNKEKSINFENIRNNINNN